MNPKARALQAVGLLAACAVSAASLAATFNVTTPAEFQAALTAARNNGGERHHPGGRGHVQT